MGRIAAVAIETVPAEPMAAVAAKTEFAGLPEVIRWGLDAVFEALVGGDYGERGAATVWYGPMPNTTVMDLRIGVRLSTPFPGPVTEVAAFETPAGEVAHAVYYGPYNQMMMAHEAAKAAARAAGRQITGESWEVYGDWNEDPDQLRTDVYWLLKAKAHG